MPEDIGPDAIEELLKNKMNESELKDLLREFISNDGIQGKTDLNDKQINLFWTLDIFNERYPGLGLDSIGGKFMHLRISKGGASRKGMVEMLRGLAQGAQPQAGPNLEMNGRRF